MDIRALTATDYPGWRILWDDYLAFYGVTIPDTVTQHTFNRLTADGAGMQGLIAVEANQPVGFAHLILHLCTWDSRPSCYLEDLFVTESARGRQIGRALLDRVIDFAHEASIGRVYWHTANTNTTARRLYDHYIEPDGFVRYRMAIPDTRKPDSA